MWKVFKGYRHAWKDTGKRPFDVAFFDEQDRYVRPYPGSFATEEAAQKKADKMNKEGRKP